VARKIIWTEKALTHLEFLILYISRDSPQLAALTVSRIMARAEQAAEFPESGRIVPEYGDPGLRELFWKAYRIVYRLEEGRIAIVGVVHGSRQLDEAL
jgi:plasmid stabilization system protein ParE